MPLMSTANAKESLTFVQLLIIIRHGLLTLVIETSCHISLSLLSRSRPRKRCPSIPSVTCFVSALAQATSMVQVMRSLIDGLFSCSTMRGELCARVICEWFSMHLWFLSGGFVDSTPRVDILRMDVRIIFAPLVKSIIVNNSFGKWE